MISRLRSLLSQDRGSALALIAIFLLGILGMLALAVDLGMLYEARGQAQRTADAAALAAAAALVDYGNSPGVETRAFEYATAYVESNPVRSELASVDPADVVVNLDLWRVTVTVRRTADRGNPVPTVFGRIVGRESVDVSAVATAEAAEASGVNCLLPLALPDRWEDVDGNGVFNVEGDDYYKPWPEAGATGYGDDDIGTPVVIKPFKESGQLNPSWYYPWRPEGGAGGADYRENVRACVDSRQAYYFGDVVDTEPGAMVGPTMQGFGDVIAEDPDAYWDEDERCVRRNGRCAHYSPRIRPMPLFDPRESPDPGAKPFTFTNFVSVFIDRIQANEVHAYLLGLAGVVPGTGTGGGGAPVRYVRLIR